MCIHTVATLNSRDSKPEITNHVVLSPSRSFTLMSLIYAMGRQAENIFKSFIFESREPSDIDPAPVDPKDDFDIVLEKFEQYFVPKRNTIHERALFYQRSQQPGESVEAFVRSLHELADHCRFEEKESEHVRDRLISGMLDKDMSLNLQLEQDNLALEKAVDSARHCELVKSQNESQVNFVTKGYNQKKRQQQRYGKLQQAPDRRQINRKYLRPMWLHA